MMAGNQYISQPRAVQTKYVEQILKSWENDINWTIMKTAHNVDSGSYSLGQMLALHCIWEGVFTMGHFYTMAASPPPRLLNRSLRQVYKGPVRHRGTSSRPEEIYVTSCSLTAFNADISVANSVLCCVYFQHQPAPKAQEVTSSHFNGINNPQSLHFQWMKQRIWSAKKN